jgi:hypothetical protein
VRGADGLVLAADTGPRRSLRAFTIGGLLIAFVFAMVVAQFAAPDPDGLERVAEDTGFAASADDHALSSSIFADYATAGIRNEQVSLAVAGAAGTLVTLLVGWGLVSAARLGRRRDEPTERDVPPTDRPVTWPAS